MAKARAEIEITASDQKLAADLRAASSQFASWARATASTANREFAKVGKNVGSGLGKGGVAIGNFAGNLITKGFDKVVDTAHDVQDFERDLVRLQITANQGPQWADQMRDSIRALSRETAVNSTEILHATASYVDLTGDVAGAEASMRTFARVAQASGSNMGDVSTAAAALGDSLHINASDFESTFSGLIMQGKAGAVTLKDFAAELSSLAPKFARFGVTGRDGAIELGAALQVARHGFGSASEAATGLESLMGALAKNADKFAAAGVKVFEVRNGEKVFRSLHEIVTAIGQSKLAKDPTLLAKAFGRKEAESTFNQLNRLKDMYGQMIEAGQDSGAVQRDLDTFMDSAAGRIDRAWNNVKETIAGIFTPERIEAFADVAERAAEKLGSAVKALGDFSDKYLTHKEEITKNPFDERAKDLPAWAARQMPALNEAVMAEQRRHDVQKLIPGTDEHFAEKNRVAFDEELAGIRAAPNRAKQRERAIQDAAFDRLHAGEDLAKYPGWQGRREAGQQFLIRDGMKADEIQAAIDAKVVQAIGKAGLADMSALFDRLGTRIENAIGAAKPEVKLGDNQVARSVNKATDARYGGG